MCLDHERARPFRRSLLGLLLFAALGGCCAPEYRLEDMRSRSLRTPCDTVDYFLYAVRLDAWDAIYEILSPASKDYIDEEIGRFAFETFASGLTYKRLDPNASPEVADLTVAQLIHRSEIIAVRADDVRPGRIWWVQLYYAPIPPSKTKFPLVNAAEPGKRARWTVGLYEWIDPSALQ